MVQQARTILRAIVKSRTGEVRLFWRFLILLVGFLALAFLLRAIPITAYSWFLSSSGTASAEATEIASAVFLEDPTWKAVLGAMQIFLWFSVVWFLIRIIEKRTVSSQDFGLKGSRNRLPHVGLGVLLGVALYVAPLLLGRILGLATFSTPELISRLDVQTCVLAFVGFVPNGFGEELGFRVYFQTRLVEKLGASWGIVIGSVVFTLTHLLMRSLSLVQLASGVCLYIVVGLLYHRSQSLFLVGTVHGVLNVLPQVFDLWPPDVAGAIINAVAVLLTIAVAYPRTKTRNAVSESWPASNEGP